MKHRLWLWLAGMAVLVAFTASGTTTALWRDEATLDPGPVTTGNLELLAGGQLETYIFDALSAANLAPGDSSSAPLTITNSGSTELTYSLETVSTRSSDTSTPSTADADLVKALTLVVTTDATCDGTVPEAGVDKLYEGPLATAAFTGSQLAASSSSDLCLTVALAEAAPIEASQGAVSATFIFRGNQVQ